MPHSTPTTEPDATNQDVGTTLGNLTEADALALTPMLIPAQRTEQAPATQAIPTSPFYTDDSVTLWHGDCLDVIRLLPDNSVDSIVTDPPYELTSGKKGGTGTASLNLDSPAGRARISTGGFMGQQWDATGIAHNVELWAECLRVLKPGGHVVAFGGSRTWHRLAVAIEDAGFTIRDSISWIYSTGFPKSLDVSKAIDKAGGVSPVDQAVVLRAARTRAGLSREELATQVGCTPASIRDWEEGRARLAGAPVEHIIPSPEYRAKLAAILGYTADERRIAGISIDRRDDGTVMGLGHSGVAYDNTASTSNAEKWAGWGTALKPAFEPIVVGRKPLAGTVASNVLTFGTGALNIDGCRTGTIADQPGSTPPSTGERNSMSGDLPRQGYTPAAGGRWPTNVAFDEFQARELDSQTGVSVSRAGAPRSGASGEGWGMTATGAEYNDEGGASRYFPTFKYEAKAPTSERPSDGDLTHPTVKPVDLMRWLVRLVTPPGGICLEPFAGSGTTAEACVVEGFKCIAIEREAMYLPLIVSRLSKPIELDLFGGLI